LDNSDSIKGSHSQKMKNPSKYDGKSTATNLKPGQFGQQ
jgi:hypothetical protein